MKDISERCGVARSLFYHYFRNKQEVTSAVIDDFVNDYIESLQFWNEHRTPGDIEGSLAGVVTVMRVASSSTPASAAPLTRTRTRRCTWSSSTA